MSRHRPSPRPFRPRLEVLEDRVMLNVAPVVTYPGTQPSSEGSSISLQIHASDADGDVLTYSASGLPQGLSINASTGLITGIMGYDVADPFRGGITAAIFVSDGSHLVTGSADWGVIDTNRLPTTTNQSGVEGHAVSVDFHATDNTGTNSLTYSATGLPTGLSIVSSTGLITGSLDYHSAPGLGSSYTPTITLQDDHGGTDTRALFWSITDVEPLTLSSASGTEGVSVSLFAGSVQSGTTGLTYSASNLPQGLSINASTGLVTGIVGYSIATGTSGGTVTTTLTASDDRGAFQSQSVVWSVTNTNRLPSVGTQSGTEGNAVSLDMHGTDNSGTNSLTYSASNLPHGLHIDTSTGLISGVLAFDNATTASPTVSFSVAVTLQDDHGGTDSRTFTWSVVNAPPLTLATSASVAEAAGVSMTAGPDHTGTNGLTYSASGLPNGLAINSSTGLIGGAVIYAVATTGSSATATSGVTASDSSGVLEVVSITWSIADTNRLPTQPVQAGGIGLSMSLDEHANDVLGDTLTYSASGLPSGLAINVSTGLISGTVGPSAAPSGSESVYSPTVTVIDNHGGLDLRVLGYVISDPAFSWSMSGVVSPSIGSVASQAGAEGDVVSLQVTASTSATYSYTLSYAAIDLPAGLSIDPTTGLITGTLGYQDAQDFGGTWAPVVIVGDGNGGSSMQGFAWTVSDTPAAPSITSVAAQAGGRGDAVSFQVSAGFTDGTGLTYDATGLPDGLSIDPDTGVISGTVGYVAGEPPVDSVTVTVDDGVNAPVSETFAWTVGVGTNHAPVWQSVADQVDAAGDVIDGFVEADDPDGDVLVYTAVGLPTGLSIDPASGEITGTIANAAASTTAHTVTLMASDGDTASNFTFSWEVDAVGLGAPGDQAGVVGDTVSLALQGVDATGGSLTYAASSLPGGLTLNAGTGLITGTLSSAASATVTLTASDGGLSSAQTFTWSVSALSLDVPADQFSAEGGTVSLQLHATDVGGTPTYSATNLPTGLTLNAATGLITGAIGLAAHGSSPYGVSVTATDGSASDTEEFVWAVTPEVALLAPGVQSSAQGDAVSLALTGFSPSGTLTFAASGLPTGLTIGSGTGVISGTLGGATSQSAPYAVTVTVTDGTASTTDVFDWSVSELLLPTEDADNLDGDTVSLSLGASYHGTATLTYAVTGLPTGLTLNASTGLVTGTLSSTADADGPYDVTAAVTAGTLSVTQEFFWDVEPRIELGGADDQYDMGGDTVSLDLSGIDATSGTLTYSISGLPTGLSIDASTGLVTGTIATSAVSSTPATVTLTVSDGSVTASETFQWSVAELGMYDPGTPLTVKGQSVSVSLTGVAADGGSLTYAASGLPTGLTLNASTGLVTGTASSFGAYVVGVTLSEGTYSTTGSFEWDVAQAGLANPGTLTNREGDAVSLTLQGASATGGSLTYLASGLPTGLTLDASTGVITGTLAAGSADGGPYYVMVAVGDGTATGQQQFEWDVNPYVELAEPDDQANLEGDAVSLSVAGTDAGSLALTYSATSLPTGLSIDSSTGLISGTVVTGAALSQSFVEVTLTATDGTYSETEYFGWSLKPATAPAAASITSIGFRGNQSGDEVSVQVSATDSAGYSLTYDAMNLPDGLYIDPDTGLISGTLDDYAVSPTPYAVTVTADDGVGETTSLTFQWAVNPAPLALSVTPITAVEGGATGSSTLLTFSTPDLGTDPSEYDATISWGDGTTDEGVVDGADGTFTVSGDHTYASSGTYTLDVTVIRPDGGLVTATGTETVSAAAVSFTTGFQEGALVGESGEMIDEFTDEEPGVGAGDFSVTIDPGDGSGSVAGAVTSLGDGLFAIALPHGYAHTGAYTESITVTDPHGAVKSTLSTVEVGDLDAGVPYTLTAATFDVGDGSAVASSYAATITWGDGTSTSVGTVTGSGGVFTVTGDHTYATDSIDATGGAYNVSVTLTKAGQSVMSASHPVVVTRPPGSGRMASVIEGADGTVASQTIATFEVADGTDTTAEYSATIDWGDGTTSTGMISGGGGLFTVEGGHTYTTTGEHLVRVDLDQGWSDYKLFATLMGGVSGYPAEGKKVYPPTVWGDKPLIGGPYLGDRGEFFYSTAWKINVPRNTAYKPDLKDSTAIKGIPTAVGGLILQRVTYTITLSSFEDDYDPRTSVDTNTLKLLKDLFPGYMRVTAPASGAPYRITMVYWEAWEVQPGKDAPSSETNPYGGPLPTNIFSKQMQKNLLAVNYYNDAFSSGGFPGAKSGTVVISGQVWYVDGAKLSDVGLKAPAKGIGSPAGVLPAVNAQNLTTGSSNAADAKIKAFIKDREKNQPLTISAEASHLAQVKWSKGGKSVYLKGVQADNFKTP